MLSFKSDYNRVLGCLMALFFAVVPIQAQIQIDTVVAVGDSLSRFWLQVPANYNPAHPPALLVWWHQLGGNEHEMRNYTDFDGEANRRGWLAASHFGWCDRHWNNQLAQDYATAMLGWIRDNYPFDEDSLYFIGGSMGGAAGMVYHNNHCDSRGFFVAATASGSGIMDCYRRALEQWPDTNQSMRTAFGGLPWEAPYGYQRNSAIYFDDTTLSMHYNSQHLPVLLTFGLDEEPWKSHALDLDSARQDWADTTYTYESPNVGHGYPIMQPPEICNWLSGFRANRYPDRISINADEAGRYYWVRAQPTFPESTFCRFEGRKAGAENRVDIAVIRNIAALEIDGEELGLDLSRIVLGHWSNDEAGRQTEVAITGFEARPDSVTLDGISFSQWNYIPAEGKLVAFVGEGGLFRVYPSGSSTESMPQAARVATELLGNYPNPFNESTCFLLEQAKPGPATLVVYNLLGQAVWKWSATVSTGTHRILFDAKTLSSGVYLYYLESAPQSPVYRMTLLR